MPESASLSTTSDDRPISVTVDQTGKVALALLADESPHLFSYNDDRNQAGELDLPIDFILQAPDISPTWQDVVIDPNDGTQYFLTTATDPNTGELTLNIFDDTVSPRKQTPLARKRGVAQIDLPSQFLLGNDGNFYVVSHVPGAQEDTDVWIGR